MNRFLLILFLLATTFSHSQEAIHFLFTSEGNCQITEPLCEDMMVELERMIKSEKKKYKEAKKSGRYDIEKVGIQKSALFEMRQKLMENPKNYFPSFCIMKDIYNNYQVQYPDLIYFSLQKVGLKEIGKPNIQINIRNMVVSPATTSLDMDVIDLNQAGAPKESKHFSCSTEQLLENRPTYKQWLSFWQRFFEEVQYQEWLNVELYKINANLISEQQRNEMIEAKLIELGMKAPSYLHERVAKLKDKLSGFPTHVINIEQTTGILMSSDENKFLVYTLFENPNILWEHPNAEDSSKKFESTTWIIEFKPNGEMQFGYFATEYRINPNIDKNLTQFYSYAFASAPHIAYNEAQWITTFFNNENIYASGDFKVFRHESQSNETSLLLKNYIEPIFHQLVNDSSVYNNYYQRITAENINQYNFDEETQTTILKDYLISNPEKTAFIYPVLLQNRLEQHSEYYYTEEDFKFYVLLKNEQGTFDLYDWHYFSALPYKNYYSLLTCAHAHLRKISNWDEESDIISDEAFWNNYIFKKSERGYDHLTMITPTNQSPIVTQAEFEAQVKDSYQILSEKDVVDLYGNQLKQIILCLNTIQHYQLKGTDELQLQNLAKLLNFQNRVNKNLKFYGHYYPSLNIEYGGTTLPHSYYQFK